MKHLVALLALGAAACADSTAPLPTRSLQPTGSSSHAATVQRQSVPFSVVACNGEPVAGTADQHVVLNFVDTPAGRVIASINESEKIDGVGAVTGAHYSGTDKIQSRSIGNDVATDAHGATVLRVTSRLRLSARGQPDSDVNVMTMFVANGQGDPVVQKSEFSTSCGT